MEVRYEDSLWILGPADADQVVTGDALEFALLATRRRHCRECDVAAVGKGAEMWLNIVQAYAGDRGPGHFPATSPGLDEGEGGGGDGEACDPLRDGLVEAGRHRVGTGRGEGCVGGDPGADLV